MDDSNEPVDLEVKRDEGVTIRFADGHVAQIGLLELRDRDVRARRVARCGSVEK